MPFKDINAPKVCPYCTLKMHCEKHKGQPYHGNRSFISQPQNEKATLEKLYYDMVGSKLERYQPKDSEGEQSYWSSVLEKKKSEESANKKKSKKVKKKSISKKHKKKHHQSKKHSKYHRSSSNSSSNSSNSASKSSEASSIKSIRKSKSKSRNYRDHKNPEKSHKKSRKRSYPSSDSESLSMQRLKRSRNS